MTDDDEQKRLLEVLLEGERLQLTLQSELQRGVGYTQKSLNNTRAAVEIAQHGLIRGESAQRLRSAYQSLNDQTRTLTQEMRESLWAYGTGTTQASSSASTAVLKIVLQQPPAPLPPPAKASLERYLLLAKRSNSVEEARADLSRCGLDTGRGGNRSPVDLLNECVAALEQPSRPELSPTSALIPLRGCIGRAVLDLLLRCQGQEQTKNWKERILSLGRRCGRIGIASGHFDALANIAADKIDAISDGKESAMTRAQVEWLFADGLNFLTALLRGVDERRLRR